MLQVLAQEFGEMIPLVSDQILIDAEGLQALESLKDASLIKPIEGQDEDDIS